jgi:hypothetical protein
MVRALTIRFAAKAVRNWHEMTSTNCLPSPCTLPEGEGLVEKVISCQFLSAVAGVLIGFSAPATAASLDPATFDEYVGITGGTISGVDSSVAESVNLIVTNEQSDDRGSGDGFSRASGALPVVAEVGMNIFGSVNLSGIGGTVTTLTRYQFAVEPLEAGLPTTVPVRLSMAGYVSVDTSLTESIGRTFARITTPAGQFEAHNYDAQGAYEGVFSFNETRSIDVTADAAQTISMHVSSHGEGSGTGFFYSSYAYVDPLIEIDPAFAFHDQFHIVYSSGITGVIGDANADGVVDIFDINLVSSNWGTAGPTGDVNSDGVVDIFDINLISSHWGAMAGGATVVAEPSTLILAAAAVAVAIAARGRIRRVGGAASGFAKKTT